MRTEAESQPICVSLKVIAYFDPFAENLFSHKVCQHSQYSCPLQSEHQTHVS